MPLPRSSARIIRSIRQISLHKEWVRLRGDHRLPNLTDFEPDNRAGDANELGVAEIVRCGDSVRYLSHQSGDQATRRIGKEPTGRYLDEMLPPTVLDNAQRYWDACTNVQLPVFERAQRADADGNRVTLEHLYLPFSANHQDTLYMVALMQVFAEDGNYRLDGLYQIDKFLTSEGYIIDPALVSDEIELNNSGFELL